MGSIVSGILGGGASGSSGIQSAEQNLLGTTQSNTESQMNLEASLDTLQTQNQEASQIANTANQIASTWEQVSSAKDQAEQSIVKSDTQAVAQS